MPAEEASLVCAFLHSAGGILLISVFASHEHGKKFISENSFLSF